MPVGGLPVGGDGVGTFRLMRLLWYSAPQPEVPIEGVLEKDFYMRNMDRRGRFGAKWKTVVAAGLALVLTSGVAIAQKSPAQGGGDALKNGFVTPPQSARPLVWWHWMNGNISKEGIKLDLEWMHRVGIGGFQNFDAALATPQVVDKRLAYMTPEWKDAFKYATTLADKFGMEEGIAGSPGWSESGGPWVTGPEAMKKYVWSETVVEGGKTFTGTLAHPPTNNGPFQNLPAASSAFSQPQFYADSTVVAYRAPATEMQQAKITSSGGAIDPALLNDGDLTKTVALPKAVAGEKAWIQYEFPQAQKVCAVTIVRVSSGAGDDYFSRGGSPDSGEALEASDDGVSFRVVATVPKGGSAEHTIAFAPVSAKYFRMTFATPAARAGAAAAKTPANIALAELVLHADARVNRFEEKAAFTQMLDLYGFATPRGDGADVIRKGDVIDLTGKIHADGTLEWTPPAGRWVVMRFGYSLLGITNHPATKEATGLEVDKLDARYVKDYMDKYLDSYKETVGAEFMGKRGIKYVINDSWEAGTQNWTDNMIADFTRLRGYDPHAWLPVLAGHVVESAQASDQFLWDLRKTIADLTATEHYGQLEKTLKERGMGHYGESHEGGRAFIADGMEVKKMNDIPMSAMWVQAPGVNREMYGYNADDRESASVAHIYGQNLAAAESMTARINSAWAWSPGTLKPTADQELVNGINRFVIHESAHQPLVDKAPGLTLGPYGQWFNRFETWAEEAKPWVDYLARSSYMLQQGRFAADVLYFYGEDSNITAIFGDKAPNVPAGYGFDYINADGMIHILHASKGRITTASGMNYRLLVLDPYSRHMSLPVLRAMHKLVMQGAVVAGEKPTDTPSLADDQAEFRKLDDELFGDGSGVHAVGKGKVFAGQAAEDALKAMEVAPDFDHSKPESDTRIVFVHRKLADGDIYFLDNRNDRDERVEATFRVTGKMPELWHAETGKSEAVSYRIADGHTTVPLHLEPWGTVFVVFRKAAAVPARVLPSMAETKLAEVEGPWNVSFQEKRGTPASVTLDKLVSWTDSADGGVKYFSGAGTYTKSVEAPADWFKPGARLWIDLGDVEDLAEVSVNGTSLGVVWHAPYRVDVTKALKPGKNEVTIKVINTWVNRLIGDQQPNATKYTFPDIAPYTAESPLQPSGLLGPVVVVRDAAK
jgi:alpha-L-rhamnosidase